LDIHNTGCKSVSLLLSRLAQPARGSLQGRVEQFADWDSLTFPMGSDAERLEELVHMAVAVGELVEADTDLVEQREVEIGQRR
jgi:hypothetical protein